jgi:hypothetical protein
MAARAKMAALIGKDQKIFVTTLPTSDLGKAVTKNSTVQVAVDPRPQIKKVKLIGQPKTPLIDLFKIPGMFLRVYSSLWGTAVCMPAGIHPVALTKTEVSSSAASVTHP